MSISIRILLFNIACLASIAAVSGVVEPAGAEPARVQNGDVAQHHPILNPAPKHIVDAVWQLIDQNYVDADFNQTDWQAVRTEYLGRSYADPQAAYEAIREMLEPLGDPYTRFVDPQEFENLQVDTSGELTGVGIQLAQDEETKQLLVVAPIEDTPAFTAGILSQDVILAIDGQSTDGMELNGAVKLIRGPIGSTVNLTLLRGEEQLEVEIVRARIELHPVRYSYQPDVGDLNGVGYIRLTQFSAKAVAEMRQAIAALEEENLAGYILDLRSNPGGLLTASVDISRMWLERGVVVSTVNRRGTSDTQIARGKALTDKPLVILVDGGSASASEIVSGALQDNNRAKLVGTQTFGKGTVQAVRALPDSSGLLMTIAKYLTPSGRDINEQGIEPDLIVELTEADQERLVNDRSLIGTLDDPQYAAAVDVLEQQVDAETQAAVSVP